MVRRLLQCFLLSRKHSSRSDWPEVRFRVRGAGRIVAEFGQRLPCRRPPTSSLSYASSRYWIPRADGGWRPISPKIGTIRLFGPTGRTDFLVIFHSIYEESIRRTSSQVKPRNRVPN